MFPKMPCERQPIPARPVGGKGAEAGTDAVCSSWIAVRMLSGSGAITKRRGRKIQVLPRSFAEAPHPPPCSKPTLECCIMDLPFPSVPVAPIRKSGQDYRAWPLGHCPGASRASSRTNQTTSTRRLGQQSHGDTHTSAMRRRSVETEETEQASASITDADDVPGAPHAFPSSARASKWASGFCSAAPWQDGVIDMLSGEFFQKGFHHGRPRRISERARQCCASIFNLPVGHATPLAPSPLLVFALMPQKLASASRYSQQLLAWWYRLGASCLSSKSEGAQRRRGEDAELPIIMRPPPPARLILSP